MMYLARRVAMQDRAGEWSMAQVWRGLGNTKAADGEVAAVAVEHEAELRLLLLLGLMDGMLGQWLQLVRFSLLRHVPVVPHFLCLLCPTSVACRSKAVLPTCLPDGRTG
jgi:hypothetical protein